MTRLLTTLFAILLAVPVMADDATPITGNSTVGALTSQSERLGDGSRAERYTVDLAAGEELTATMVSTDFDAFLHLEGPNGDSLGHDDDSGGGLNARLQFVAPEAGQYTIIANSVSPGVTGQFTLLVNRNIVGELIGTFSGHVAPQDGKMLKPVDNPTHSVTASAGQILDVIATSNNFDTYVEVYAPNGALVGEDDDSAGGSNSRAQVQITESGAYTIRVRSYSEGSGGPYQLVVRAGDAKEMAVGGTRFERAEMLTGTLSGSGKSLGGSGTHVIEANAGDFIEVSLMSTDFDAVVRVFDPDGVLIAEDDDSGSNSNALTSFVADRDGNYTVRAGSYSGDDGGDYRLNLRFDTDGTVQILSGRLSSASNRMPDGTPFEVHEIEAAAGEQIDIRLLSNEFDAYLLIFDAADNKLAEDDDSGGGMSAHLVWIAPADGRYKVVANAFGDNSNGEYRLIIRR